jgi:transposase
MKITVCGVDLAKEVFQFHGVDAVGKTKRQKLKRREVMEFFATLPPCMIGMEACGSAHYWARELQSLGHTVKLIAPQFVKPYVKTNKHDAADAEAICEAVQRPNMRFVPIKTIEQQSVLAVHTVREGFIKQRTAQANQIRGLLSEFGLTVPQGVTVLRERVPTLLDEARDRLPMDFIELILDLLEHLKELSQKVDKYEQRIHRLHRSNELSKKLEKVPGIGPITASALVASIGNARNFANGRQLAAWLGLVPKQHSTGGRTNLQGISKRGNTYLRTLLIHGARAVIRYAVNKDRNKSDWLHSLLGRRHKNVATVALANKNARIVWALLAHDWQFQADYAAA